VQGRLWRYIKSINFLTLSVNSYTFQRDGLEGDMLGCLTERYNIDIIFTNFCSWLKIKWSWENRKWILKVGLFGKCNCFDIKQSNHLQHIYDVLVVLVSESYLWKRFHSFFLILGHCRILVLALNKFSTWKVLLAFETKRSHKGQGQVNREVGGTLS
jgi:hypothetical protein